MSSWFVFMVCHDLIHHNVFVRATMFVLRFIIGVRCRLIKSICLGWYIIRYLFWCSCVYWSCCLIFGVSFIHTWWFSMITVIDIKCVNSLTLYCVIGAGVSKKRLRETISPDLSGSSMITVFVSSSILITGNGPSAIYASFSESLCRPSSRPWVARCRWALYSQKYCAASCQRSSFIVIGLSGVVLVSLRTPWRSIFHLWLKYSGPLYSVDGSDDAMGPSGLERTSSNCTMDVDVWGYVLFSYVSE